MGTPSLTPDQTLAPPSVPLPVAGTSPDQAAAVQQVVQAPVAQATQTHRDFASKILGAISDVLGGKSSPQYSRDASGALSTTQHINTRGEQARNIIGTALQGAAAGASQQGPNAEGRAFAAGLGGKMQADQAQDQTKRAQADQDFETKQKQTLQNAQIANYNNQNLLERRRLDQADKAEQDKLVENQNAVAQRLEAAGAVTPPVIVDGKDINGTAGNEQAMMKYFSDPQNHAVTDGQALMHTYSRDEKGQMIDTVHLVPKDQLKTTMVEPSPEVKKAYALPSGTKLSLGDSITLDTKLKEQGNKEAMDAATIKEKNANAAQSLASAAKSRSEVIPSSPNGAALQGEDYIKTLPSSEAQYLRTIAAGKQNLPPSRSKEGLKIAKQMASAYPDYDSSKQPAYMKTRAAFTSGAESKGINAFNTAIAHLGEVYDHADSAVGAGAKSFFGNKDAAALNTARTAVAEELAKAYAGGQASLEQVKSMKELLDTQSPAKLKNNVKEVVQLLKGKLESYNDQWENAKPSASIPNFKVLSDKSASVLDKIEGKNTPPPGATAEVTDASGKLIGHAVNGKYVALGQ